MGDAWHQFCIEKDELVRNIFQKLRCLHINGSAEHELDIKGSGGGVRVGGWSRSQGRDSGSLNMVTTSPELLNHSSAQFADVDDCTLIEFVADGE